MALSLLRIELAYALQRHVTMNEMALIEQVAERSRVFTHAIQHFASAVKYALRSPASGQQRRKCDRTQYLFHAVVSYLFDCVRLTPVGCQEISMLLF